MTDRIASQPVTLAIVPVELQDDPARAEALAASNGRDLSRERVTRTAITIAFFVVVLAVTRCLLGCAALAGAGPALQTARDVAKTGCAILAASDGSSADVLARTQDLQRAILATAAQDATAKGADVARVEQDMKTIAVLADALRTVSLAIVQAAGNGPAKLPPCAALAATTAPITAPP